MRYITWLWKRFAFSRPEVSGTTIEMSKNREESGDSIGHGVRRSILGRERQTRPSINKRASSTLIKSLVVVVVEKRRSNFIAAD